MLRIRSLLCPLLTLALLAACSGDGSNGGTDSWTTTIESAGDTIRAVTRGNVAESGTLRLTERWRVGDQEGLDPTRTFGNISGFAVASDNSVAVFDASGPSLRVYDANGAYVRTIGQKGAGPGEYTQANGIAFLPDDRLALWDAPTSRITIYDREGSVVTSWQPPVTGMWMNDALSPVSTATLAVRAPLPDSSRLREDGRPESQDAWFLYDSTGVARDTLVGALPRREAPMLSVVTSTMMAVYGIPFMPDRQATLLPDGRIAEGYGDAYSLIVSGQGLPLRISRDATPVAVQSQEAEEQRAAVEFAMTRVRADWRWDGPGIPTEKPYFSELLAGHDARLWVRVAAPGERIPEAERAAPAASGPGSPPAAPAVTWREPQWYDLFEADGALLGRVVLPPRATLLGSRGNTVWGVVRDDLDVPSLVAWRLSDVAAP